MRPADKPKFDIYLEPIEDEGGKNAVFLKWTSNDVMSFSNEVGFLNSNDFGEFAMDAVKFAIANNILTPSKLKELNGDIISIIGI